MQEMAGEIEIDETYIGGKEHGGKGSHIVKGKKVTFLGIAQRNGIMAAVQIPNVKSKTILPIIRKYVVGYSMVYTDSLPSYIHLDDTLTFTGKLITLLNNG